MTLPNTFLIGAARCGTTALSRCLARHPQVSIPFKEPDYVCGWNLEPYVGASAEFHRKQASRYVRFEDYSALYKDSAGAKVICDASVSSLPAERSAEVIYRMAPRARMFAVVREPVERAFSHFHFNIALGVELETDFIAFVHNEPERIRQNWYPNSRYLETSHYPLQVRRFQARFAVDQLFWATYEDWNDQPQEFLKRLLGFLELDDAGDLNAGARVGETVIPSAPWRAVSGVRSVLKQIVPRHLAAPFLGRIRPRIYSRPRLDPELRRELTERYFREDILKLQDMLRRDLTAWLE